MRIVIDLQGRQSRDSRYRGIGRYSLSIAKSIVRNKKDHEVIIVLSDAFPDTIEEITNELSTVMSKRDIHIWSAPKNISYIDSNNSHRKSAELNRELFLHSLNPDIIYVTSLIEGFHDDMVTSVTTIKSHVPVAVTLYDLIPLMNSDRYLENKDIRSWYEGKIEHFKRADLLVSISESSRQEAIQYLDIYENDVVNIGTAADSQFRKIEISKRQELEVKNRYKINDQFLMYTGGIDHRKNIEGLIRAYSLLSKDIREEHQLAIVCSIDENQKAILESLVATCKLDKNEIIFTGFIDETDLIVLYNTCKAFIFPSWHEGFGLPALEAMHCGAPVIAANSSSLPEVVGLEEALFDARDDKAMSVKIAQVLTDEEFRQQLIAHAEKQVNNFSWDNSAKIAIKAFENIHKQTHISKTSNDRLKLAYLSPLPPEHTGIADYSAELLPELFNYYDIDVIVEQETVSDQWINDNCAIYDTSEFKKNISKYDRVLYHFGNSHFHQHMFELLKNIPGTVVLHDFFLSGIINYAGATGDKSFSFENELTYSHGNLLDVKQDQYDLIMKYPCNKSVLDNAKGVIVHSANSKQLSKQWYGESYAKDWAVIPLLRNPVIFNKKISRTKLGLSSDAMIICSFGIIDNTKQNHRLLDAWVKSSLYNDENCHLFFVGEYLCEEYGKKMTQEIKNYDRVEITGRLEADIFRDYLAAADIGIQLRTLSRGETSAAVLDCMNYELATIVNANGSMASLPKESVLMISDEFTDDELLNALEILYKDEEYRKVLGKKARDVIEDKHAPSKCAHQYVMAIEEFHKNYSETHK